MNEKKQMGPEERVKNEIQSISSPLKKQIFLLMLKIRVTLKNTFKEST